MSLDVTAGLYVIFAKGFAKAYGDGGTKLDCTLIAGGDSDPIRVGVDGRESFRTDEEAFALNVLHAFLGKGTGTIVLRCSCDADDADLFSLKVTAVRAKSYWNLPQ